MAEALTIGNADMATGSIVRELFSTALCTSWDSYGKTVTVKYNTCKRCNISAEWWDSDLRSCEGEAGSDIFSVDPTQEGRGAVQTRMFLPHQKLCVKNWVHLQRETVNHCQWTVSTCSYSFDAPPVFTLKLWRLWIDNIKSNILNRHKWAGSVSEI